MENTFQDITQMIGAYVPNLLGAIAILVIGWIVASVISRIVKTLLKKTNLDNKLAEKIGASPDKKPFQLEQSVSRIIFWFIMLFVLVAFFQALQLTIITEPLNNLLDQVLSYLPQLFGAGILFLIAWVLATILRKLIVTGLTSLKADDRFAEKTGVDDSKKIPISKSLGDIAYWLVFLVFLPGILSALNLGGILEPIQGMLDKIFAFLPNIFTAAVIIIVGWFVAKIVRQIVTSLLSAVGLDKLAEKAGVTKTIGKQSLSGLVGLILYIIILIPIIVAGLNALQLDAITTPASNMLNQFLEAIPNIFAAAVILGISFVIAKILSGFVENLLSGIGFNNLFVKLGLQKIPSDGNKSPSKIVGFIVLLTMMLFAFIEAFNTLGFETLSDLVSQFTVLGGHILFGLVIFGIGLYFGNMANDTVKASNLSNANTIGFVARIAIIVLAGAMALRHMGLANEIINMAFGLVLGAVAVASAIAFGIGGRDIAAKKLAEWNDNFNK
ncbi:MAG: mechanosensitive ion channel [Ignavibacteriae bacterium]|nr:mechanosensitive ion channel [Ignavibacteriota bacterium]